MGLVIMQRYKRLLLMMMVLLTLGGGIVWAAPPVIHTPPMQANLFEAFILETRNDLESLADEVLGVDVRPETWKGTTDLTAPTFVPDLWFDNEQLAAEVFGVGVRPEDWFSLPANPANLDLIARNVRHDLETMADTTFGVQVRPDVWNGSAGIYRCSRTLQNVVRLLADLYNTRPSTTSEAAFNYCGALGTEVQNDLIRAVFETRQAESELPALALSLRGDLERLADESLGLNNRPPQWTNNREEGSPTLIADAAADLDRLANELLGNNVRPEGWAQYISAAPSLSYRSLRFNLELLSDLQLGEDVRPNGWQGTDPILDCAIIDQSLFFIVQQNYGYTIPESFADSPNFCQLLADDTNNIAENPPVEDVVEGPDGEPINVRYLAEAQYAFAYLDVAATQYMGAIPAGTEFRAWYRNFNESNMMFVSGQDFAVFIDRRWTTMEEDVFNTLPTLEGIRPLTFCDASWCNGPSPTPTPTGGSALLLLANAQTPQPTLDTSNLGGTTGKTQVSWNAVRVNYLLDRPENGTVQVTLELCNSSAQIACEPVLSVFDGVTNTARPVISQFNGLNVYELPYGYITQQVIESQNFISPDVWISDPTIR